MRLDLVAFSAVLAGFVSAQSSPSIPSCELEDAPAPVLVILSVSSSFWDIFTDLGGICTTKSFITGISCCIFNSCDPSDQQAALAYAHSICDPVGGSTLLPASAGCTANSTSTATTGSSGGAASASATATTTATSGGSSSAASSSGSIVLGNTSSSISAAASSASAGQSSAASSASTTATASAAGNAADGRMSVQGVGLGVVGAAFLGLAAVL
ncbi:hypothetical protein PV08_09639 [Exophiala spinifera]|uniref:CFEM domain-containing protein n=1 Tax=Exophiala spinifera TaxID=91928 RepID=A0A0D1ZHF6_9EURO|nr:uncharacterized protein PV08_09639 [Exophiala spinifera]KIW12362.1 hypothetical protein PV08_09639 [Exophiala spinifera]